MGNASRRKFSAGCEGNQNDAFGCPSSGASEDAISELGLYLFFAGLRSGLSLCQLLLRKTCEAVWISF